MGRVVHVREHGHGVHVPLLPAAAGRRRPDDHHVRARTAGRRGGGAGQHAVGGVLPRRRTQAPQYVGERISGTEAGGDDPARRIQDQHQIHTVGGRRQHLRQSTRVRLRGDLTGGHFRTTGGVVQKIGAQQRVEPATPHGQHETHRERRGRGGAAAHGRGPGPEPDPTAFFSRHRAPSGTPSRARYGWNGARTARPPSCATTRRTPRRCWGPRRPARPTPRRGCPAWRPLAPRPP